MKTFIVFMLDKNIWVARHRSINQDGMSHNVTDMLTHTDHNWDEIRWLSDSTSIVFHSCCSTQQAKLLISHKLYVTNSQPHCIVFGVPTLTEFGKCLPGYCW